MAEVKTQPVTARHIPDKSEFQDEYHMGRVPGSFRVTEDEGDLWLWYCCPCGCRSVGVLSVGKNVKPSAEHPTWKWNASFDKPSLEPSVHHVGHWHGWLRDGVWVSF